METLLLSFVLPGAGYARNRIENLTIWLAHTI